MRYPMRQIRVMRCQARVQHGVAVAMKPQHGGFALAAVEPYHFKVFAFRAGNAFISDDVINRPGQRYQQKR